jgi:hypothetical protein
MPFIFANVPKEKNKKPFNGNYDDIDLWTVFEV